MSEQEYSSLYGGWESEITDGTLHLKSTKGNKHWVAKITGTDPQYGFDREFVSYQNPGTSSRDKGSTDLQDGDVFEAVRYTHSGKNRTDEYYQYDGEGFVSIEESEARRLAERMDKDPLADLDPEKVRDRKRARHRIEEQHQAKLLEEAGEGYRSSIGFLEPSSGSGFASGFRGFMDEKEDELLAEAVASDPLRHLDDPEAEQVEGAEPAAPDGWTYTGWPSEDLHTWENDDVEGGDVTLSIEEKADTGDYYALLDGVKDDYGGKFRSVAGPADSPDDLVDEAVEWMESNPDMELIHKSAASADMFGDSEQVEESEQVTVNETPSTSTTTALTDLQGVGSSTVSKLRERGVESVDDLRDAIADGDNSIIAALPPRWRDDIVGQVVGLSDDEIDAALDIQAGRSEKALKEDYRQLSKKGLTTSFEEWRKDPARHDLPGIDTTEEWNEAVEEGRLFGDDRSEDAKAQDDRLDAETADSVDEWSEKKDSTDYPGIDSPGDSESTTTKLTAIYNRVKSRFEGDDPLSHLDD